MFIFNFGTVTFRDNLSEEQMDLIWEEFPRAFCDKNTFEITEEYGDIELELLNACDAVTKSGNPVTDVSVNYYGDYEGGYQLQDGKVVSLSEEETVISSSDDDVLIEELKKRGYDVTKE